MLLGTPMAAFPSSPESERSTWSGAATTNPQEAMWVVSVADCSGKPAYPWLKSTIGNGPAAVSGVAPT